MKFNGVYFFIYLFIFWKKRNLIGALTKAEPKSGATKATKMKRVKHKLKIATQYMRSP